MTKFKDYGKDSVLATMKSDTTDDTYDIYRISDFLLGCTCPGYGSSKRRPKVCKHIRRYKLNNMILTFENDVIEKKAGDKDAGILVKGIEDLFRKDL